MIRAKAIADTFGVPLVIAADVPKEDPEAPLKKFEGSWKVTVAERDGEKLSADKVKGIKVTIAGNQMTIKDDRGSDIATIKIDPAQKPATIDFQPADGDKAALGIYAWSGEQLKMCWGKAGGPRPRNSPPRATRKRFFLYWNDRSRPFCSALFRSTFANSPAIYQLLRSWLQLATAANRPPIRFYWSIHTD